jgi:ectoine hydroxylase-related dioxygenase (phytanoyl-CoA dioxygenase family)
MNSKIEQACQDLANKGLAIVPGVFDDQTVERLRQAFWNCHAYCKNLQDKYETTADQFNTVHHVLFLEPVFAEILEREDISEPIHTFFSTDKVVLNSIGGNNNTGTYNYAASIHRDVRFHTTEPFMLNTIVAVSALSADVGATEIMVGSEQLKMQPDESAFEQSATTIQCPAGSMVYFDSRLWHRAGKPKKNVEERIIFTPIFTRPFIKPGFNYAAAMENIGVEKFSNRMRQLAGYYSDVPNTHDEWYDYKRRRFYQREQDQW